MPTASTARRLGWMLALLLLLAPVPQAHAQSATLSIPSFTVTGVLQSQAPNAVRLETSQGMVRIPTNGATIVQNGIFVPMLGSLPYGNTTTVTIPASIGTLVGVRDDNECVIDSNYGRLVCPLALLPLSVQNSMVTVSLNGVQQWLPLNAAANMLANSDAFLPDNTLAFASPPGALALPPLVLQGTVQAFNGTAVTLRTPTGAAITVPMSLVNLTPYALAPGSFVTLDLPAFTGTVTNMVGNMMAVQTANGLVQIPYNVLPTSALTSTMVTVNLNGVPTQMTLTQAIPLVESSQATFITRYQY